MRQRLAIARTFVSGPEILLMDEPFSALDPLIRRQLQDEFRKLSRELGKTTVFITHDLDEAMRIGDRIAIMKDGQFIQVGRPEEIVMQPCDPFVEAFVQGLPRTHLLTARHLMVPVGTGADRTAASGTWSRLGRIAPEMRLADVIVRTDADPGELAVCDGDVVIGVVTRQSILQAINARLAT
jgi:glycine betaine/proline transport system ATP-binding protein